MTCLNYVTTSAFEKDFKRLLKKYKTLEKDFEIMKRAAIELYHLNGVDNNSVEQIPGFNGDTYQTYKVRKFACMSLSAGKNSGLRVIYVYEEDSQKVTFIEMYLKSEQANENRDRLQRFIDELIKK